MKTHEVLAAGLSSALLFGFSADDAEAKKKNIERTACTTEKSAASSMSPEGDRQTSAKRVTRCVTWINGVIRERDTHVNRETVTYTPDIIRTDEVNINRVTAYNSKGKRVSIISAINYEMTAIDRVPPQIEENYPNDNMGAPHTAPIPADQQPSV